MDSKSLMAEKVRRIFLRFDSNGDGGLNRSEMAALVVAVNPRVKFSDEQINAILDEVFRTYSGFISSNGLTLEGLLRTYEDGAGDVDRDFSALGLSLEEFSPSPPQESWNVAAEVETIVRGLRLQQLKKLGANGESSSTIESVEEAAWSRELGESERLVEWDEGSREFAVFRKELGGLRGRVDGLATREEAFDGHMAMGRALQERLLFGEALTSFRHAAEILPGDVRARFRAGIVLHAVGRATEAKEEFVAALHAARATGSRWAPLLPQIHVNLGVVLEGEGMLLSAAEQYREAAVLVPGHYRALKLLGSALFGVGEFRAAEKALEEAIFLKADYADARCDLGSALHAVGEDERATQEFQKAIDLKPGHVDALYNLGGLFMDIGRFARASEMYTRVLAVRPDHWRAQLNKAVALLGAGEAEEARRALGEAFKLRKRVDLRDAIAHLKMLERKKLLDGSWSVVAIEPGRFRQVGRKTTAREELRIALQIREFQVAARLNSCGVERLEEEMRRAEAPLLVRKAAVEVILRDLLQSLKPETFQEAIRSINERILSIMDYSGSGRVDLAMFFAVVAPLCAGAPEKRKKAAFDALCLRPDNGTSIKKSEAVLYVETLRSIYIPSLSASAMMEVRGDADESAVSYSAFAETFDDQEWGFGILNTLVKLEVGDRVRHGGSCCASCRYPIAGSRFREVELGFSLCSNCYSEGKVPASYKAKEYRFKEYGTEGEALKDKCACY